MPELDELCAACGKDIIETFFGERPEHYQAIYDCNIIDASNVVRTHVGPVLQEIETMQKSLDENWVTHQRVIRAEADLRRIDWLERNWELTRVCVSGADGTYPHWHYVREDGMLSIDHGNTLREMVDSAIASGRESKR